MTRRSDPAGFFVPGVFTARIDTADFAH